MPRKHYQPFSKMATTAFTYYFVILMTACNVYQLTSLSDQVRKTFTPDQNNPYVTVSKSLYKNSKIQIKVVCSDGGIGSRVKIGWVIRQVPCYEDYLDSEMMNQKSLNFFYNCPSAELLEDTVVHSVRYLKSSEEKKCNPYIQLNTKTGPFEIKHTGENDRSCQAHSLLNGKFMDSEKSSKGDVPEALPQPEAKRQVRAAVSKDKSTTDSSSSAVKEKPENKPTTIVIENVNTTAKNGSTESLKPSSMPNYQAVVDQDGLYLLIVYVSCLDVDCNATVNIEMKGDEGYLSAVDWPLLPFYGVMCAVYVIYAVVWLVISALQWRDLLRIQFWIGGVIFLGLVEKAIFYGEYQYINSTGQSIHGAILFAEIVSCVKRALARLLVIIVSLGFGIVKPRLGPVLHRIVGVGTLYLVLCVIEGCLRVLKPKNDPSNQTLMAEIPLAVLDSAICWWIFSSLVQTTRTLKLRRNVVKLTLYQHFTNTLIFAVIASIVYMFWSLYNHKLTSCITDWQELWVDEAYWHFLFSVVLMVIMILWRPTNNNQRYAFTPLLDAVDEEEDDYTATNDAFGMKSRNSKNHTNASSKNKEHRNSQSEDDLKWVEENIPSSFTDTALPSLLDSDEEIMTVRFERNKME